MNSTKEIIKAEIHVHLEATITPKLCKKFADRNKIIFLKIFLEVITHMHGMIFMIL